MNDFELKRIHADLKNLLDLNEKVKAHISELNLEIAREMPSKEYVEKIASDLQHEILDRTHAINDVQKHLSQEVSKIGHELTELRLDLRNKAGLWGAAAGLIPSILSLIAVALESLLK